MSPPSPTILILIAPLLVGLAFSLASEKWPGWFSRHAPDPVWGVIGLLVFAGICRVVALIAGGS